MASKLLGIPRGVLRRHSRGLQRVQSLLDLGLIVTTFLAVAKLPLFGLLPADLDNLPLQVFLSLLVFLAVYNLLSKVAGLNYGPRRTWPFWIELFDLTRTILAAQAAMMLYQLIFYRRALDVPRSLLFFAAVMLVLSAERGALRGALGILRRSGFNYRTMLIVGDDAVAVGVLDRLRRHRSYGLKLLGFVTDDPEELRRHNSLREGDILGSIAELDDVLDEHWVDDIYVTRRAEGFPAEVQKIIRNSIDHGVTVSVAADKAPRIAGLRSMPTRFADLQFFRFAMVPRRSYGMAVKRALDIILSGGALLLLSPLMILVALLVKVTSPGKVFFRQGRMTCGHFGPREFQMIKFRSMCADAESQKDDLRAANEADGPVFKIEQDPRVTAIGAIIRRLSIDELPQLFNVLVGQMSLVGPRPLAVEELDEDFWWSKVRLSVRPGVTGLWQINGRSTRFEDWVRYDLQYVENWSLLQDAKILLKTIPAVLTGRGAH